MDKQIPCGTLDQAKYRAFLQHHTQRLSFALQTCSVSQLLEATFPAEVLYLTRELGEEERWALSAAYRGTMQLLSEILEMRDRMDADSVDDEQQKNIELALSVLHRSVWNETSQPHMGDVCGASSHR